MSVRSVEVLLLDHWRISVDPQGWIIMFDSDGYRWFERRDIEVATDIIEMFSNDGIDPQQKTRILSLMLSRIGIVVDPSKIIAVLIHRKEDGEEEE